MPSADVVAAVKAEVAAAEAAEAAESETAEAAAEGDSSPAPPGDPPSDAASAVSDKTGDEPAKKELISPRIAAAVRAEQKARREREAAKSEREAAQRITAEAKQMLEEARAERQKWMALKDNPTEAMQALGLKPREFLHRVADDGKPSTEEEIRQLREWRDSQVKAEEERQTTAKQREQEAAAARAKEAYAKYVDTNAEKYPYLSGYDAKQIGDSSLLMAQRLYNETGRVPSDEEIGERLESEVAAWHKSYESRQSQRATAKKSAQAGTQQASNGNGTQAGKPEASQTLTNGLSASTSPPATRAETREERARKLKAELARSPVQS